MQPPSVTKESGREAREHIGQLGLAFETIGVRFDQQQVGEGQQGQHQGDRDSIQVQKSC